MIGAEAVSKVYSGRTVLANVRLSFSPREITAVVGGNGTGKSTLLRMLSGAVAPTSGRVVASGWGNISSIRQARAAGVWMADQEGSLIPAWTVEEHFQRLAGVRSQQPWRELLPHITGREFIWDLPQAERQLVEIALICEGGRTAALFDEPTAGQGKQHKELIIRSMRQAAAAGAAVVWVTHDLNAALHHAVRIVALRDGGVIADLTALETTKTKLLDSIRSASAPVLPLPSARSDGGATRRLQIRIHGCAEPIDLYGGEIVGLTSNVTSTARNALRAAAGFMDGDLPLLNIASRRGIAYMSRERANDWDFTGQSLRFNLTAGILARISRAGVIDDRAADNAATRMKAEFSIDAASLGTAIEHLSGGNRQKALLARLTAMKRQILLLDEPFSGVDEPTRGALRLLLRNIATTGVAIAIYSQEWDDLLQAVERIVVVRDDYEVVCLPADAASEALLGSLLGSADSALETL
jgi:ABC-type sugar transport system ATPase subunit